MRELTAFLFGFLSAAAICVALAFAYYLRAKKRVASIKAAIAQYHQASKVVGGVADSVYGGKKP